MDNDRPAPNPAHSPAPRDTAYRSFYECCVHCEHDPREDSPADRHQFPCAKGCNLDGQGQL